MAFAEPKHILEQLGVSSGLSVADFGSGAGHFSVEAARMVGEMGIVYAVEIQQDLLTKATNVSTPGERKIIRFINGDCEVLGGTNLQDRSVDIVLMINILFQCEDKEGTVAEAARILKEHGRLLIVDWSASFGGLGPQAEYVLVMEKARSLAEQAGFEYERALDAGDYHYGLIFRYHG